MARKVLILEREDVNRIQEALGGLTRKDLAEAMGYAHEWFSRQLGPAGAGELTYQGSQTLQQFAEERGINLKELLDDLTPETDDESGLPNGVYVPLDWRGPDAR